MHNRRPGSWAALAATAAIVVSASVLPAPARAVTAGTIVTMAGGPGAGMATEVGQTPRAIQATNDSVFVLDVDPNLPPIGVHYSGVVRRIDLATGVESVVAGDGRVLGGYQGDGGDARLARFADPADIAVDGTGNVYVADFGNNRIRRVATNGVITTIAGGSERGFGGDGGPAANALIDGPNGITADGAGRVYFYDLYNFRVRRINTDGTITTVAGNGSAGSAGDNGPAIAAELHDVRHLEIDSNGVLYLPDLTAGRIRRVAGGVITTMGVTPAFSVTSGDTPGSLFATTGYGVVKIFPDGTISSVAGANDPGYVDGPVEAARFRQVRTVARADGALYVGDYGNRRVRAVSGAMVSTIAGNGTEHGGGDGGPATDAQLDGAYSVATMPDGGVVFVDLRNNRVRRVKADGTIVAFAGSGQRGYSGDGGPATAAALDDPSSVAVEPGGTVLIADMRNHRIRRVSPGGTISTAAGTGGQASNGDGGPATAAGVPFPSALAVDPDDGTIYFRDGNTIRTISPHGIIDTLMGPDGDGYDGTPVDAASPGSVSDIAVAKDGVYFTSTYGVRRLDPCGRVSTVANLQATRGLAADGAGSLFVTETGYRGNHVRIERVSKIAVDGTITLVAGAGPADLSGDGGPATTATLDGPQDVAVLPDGDLAVAEYGNSRIRRVGGAAASAGGATRPCWSPPPTTTTTMRPPPAPVPPPPPSTPPAPTRSGYWMVTTDGAVYGFGDARHLGAGPPGSVDLEPAPDGNGYWVVDGAGAVWSRGSAQHHGSANGSLARGETVTSLSATPSGKGYWLFTTTGRVFPFGDAPFLGDMSGTRLNGPVLDSIPTPTGRGYYMVASDGGIFAFGDARFRGSMGGRSLNAPVQSLVPAPDGGYWLVASDGGVFAFATAFRGSMGGTRLNRPITGMVSFGTGYLMVGEDGGIFNFSDRPFHGSLGSSPPPAPVVGVATLSGR